MKKCKYCNKVYIDNDILKRHTSNCIEYRKFLNNKINEVITCDLLLNYFAKQYSVLHIVRLLIKKNPWITNAHIYKQARKFGLKTPSSKEAANYNTVRGKYEQTCMQKYGKQNTLSAGTPGFYKRNKTVKERYDVNNIFQDSKIKEQIKKTILDTYGVNNPTKIPGVRKNVGNSSFQHKIVEKWLEEFNIDFQSERSERQLMKFNQDLNRIYKPRPDIIISNLKLILEIYGDTWHANPKKYEDSDLIKTWSGELAAEEIRQKNRIREKHINDCGYKIIVLWGSDIKNNATTQVKTKLINEIKKVMRQKRIMANTIYL